MLVDHEDGLPGAIERAGPSTRPPAARPPSPLLSHRMGRRYGDLRPAGGGAAPPCAREDLAAADVGRHHLEGLVEQHQVGAGAGAELTAIGQTQRRAGTTEAIARAWPESRRPTPPRS